jgi:hypothetical protein
MGLQEFAWDMGMSGYGSPEAFLSSSDNPYSGAMTPSGSLDVNVSYGNGGNGITAGLYVNFEGFWPYLGCGPMTKGPGVSLMWSPTAPSHGWNVAVQGQYGVAVQGGYSLDNEDLSLEVGVGWPPGVSSTSYYVWGPFLGPTYPSVYP